MHVPYFSLPLRGRWHGEAVTEGVVAFKCIVPTVKRYVAEHGTWVVPHLTNKRSGCIIIRNPFKETPQRRRI